MLRGIVPIANSAYAADGNAHFFRYARHQVQGDRLNRRAAIASVGGLAPHNRARRESVEVQTHKRVNRIDQAHSVGSAFFGRRGNARDVGNVGRQLDDHRCPRRLLHPRSDHLRVLGHLADSRAHAALAHTVRAAKVEFQRVRAGVFGAAHHLVPGFALRFHHQRSDHQMLWVAFLHLVDFAEVVFNRPVADQLDIVEPHYLDAVQVNRAVARGGVDDWLANRLPHRAAPAGVKRAHYLPGRIRRRPAGQPERVGRFKAAKLYAQVRHMSPHKTICNHR